MKNQNLFWKKLRAKSRNVCYHSVQNILSSNALSQHIRIKIHRNMTLPVDLYGCET